MARGNCGTCASYMAEGNWCKVRGIKVGPVDPACDQYAAAYADPPSFQSLAQSRLWRNRSPSRAPDGRRSGKAAIVSFNPMTNGLEIEDPSAAPGDLASCKWGFPEPAPERCYLCGFQSRCRPLRMAMSFGPAELREE